mmetsp:Transcript_64961/g.174401  ORF Transcript_64961/g.174401 Transcript_64961/m.174401 type:complete len:80 (+) Transcript_64961:408-647(+)
MHNDSIHRLPNPASEPGQRTRPALPNPASKDSQPDFVAWAEGDVVTMGIRVRVDLNGQNFGRNAANAWPSLTGHTEALS